MANTNEITITKTKKSKNPNNIKENNKSKNSIKNESNNIEKNNTKNIKKDNTNKNVEIKKLYDKEVSLKEVFEFYDELNKDKSHMVSKDDICTPMECVRKMIDYIPQEFWEREKIKVLDPCAGNGNFGAYCMTKTSIDNIWFNEINEIRYKNCRKILKPKHMRKKDFFEMKRKEWDLIMANPPYSGGGNKNKSLSNEFIEHAIDVLKDNGYLCFVTPNNWMTYNNNNTTLKKLLNQGSFLVIDNDVKKYFNGVGSSFTIFIWQKKVLDNRTLVVNNYLKKDIQKDVTIYRNLKFIPLYISQNILDIIMKTIGDDENNRFFYRCDLHNYTQKEYLSDEQDEEFKYRTIHTMRKVRFASKKQDIYDKWNIIIPLSTYFIPEVMNDVNVTQSVGYISFDSKDEADNYLNVIEEPWYKLIIHLTRYGNFNNIMVLKHLKFDENINFTENEMNEINSLINEIKY